MVERVKDPGRNGEFADQAARQHLAAGGRLRGQQVGGQNVFAQGCLPGRHLRQQCVHVQVHGRRGACFLGQQGKEPFEQARVAVRNLDGALAQLGLVSGRGSPLLRRQAAHLLLHRLVIQPFKLVSNKRIRPLPGGPIAAGDQQAMLLSLVVAPLQSKAEVIQQLHRAARQQRPAIHQPERARGLFKIVLKVVQDDEQLLGAAG